MKDSSDSQIINFLLPNFRIINLRTIKANCNNAWAVVEMK